jgi:glycosyltransferase involved in cell wall biosynthesis
MPTTRTDVNRTAARGQAPPVSVVILTLDEQDNIADCLRSCAWADDVHVLDSGSRDRTCAIAEQMGARVHHNRFESFAQQRNWAIDNIPCRHEWQFHLDADERFEPPLVAEMARLLGPDGRRARQDAYLVPSRLIFMGRWLRYSGAYPTYQVRLLHRDRCRFIDYGHGQREVCRHVGRLRSPYTHLNFSKGLTDWFDKHNRYSDREADQAVAVRSAGGPALAALLGGDATQARRALKGLSYFIRGRALMRFVYLYFLRLGLLDGPAGYHYCAMLSMYDYWTELKIREREAPWADRTSELAGRMLAEPAP